MTNENSLKNVLFDLDETMYPTETGVMELIGERINEYMSLRLGIHPDEVAALRDAYYKRYGTTGRGLYLHYNMDVGDYFEFVHDLPLDDLLEPDPRLDEMLGSLDLQKVIFTNATAEHARRVLQVLQVEQHFDLIVGIKELEYLPKPDMRAYRRTLELLDVRPEECLLIDDRVRNLEPGRRLGMTTVLVGGPVVDDGADFAIEEIVQLGGLMKEIRSRHQRPGQ